MPKARTNTHGHPTDPPRVPRWMRRDALPPPITDPESVSTYPGYITRVNFVHGYIIRARLENGYWTYRPGRMDHLTEPPRRWRSTFGLERKDLSLPQRKIFLKERSWMYAPEMDGEEKKGENGEGKMKRKEKARMFRRAKKIKGESVLVGLDRHGNFLYKKEEEERIAAAALGREALPEVRDEPVENGVELAREKVQLPSDGWRGARLGVDRGVSVISREEKEMEELRRAIRASEEELERVTEAPAYSVRVVPLRKKGKRGIEMKDVEEDEPIEETLVVEDVEEGSWDDLLAELEAQGWVPVDEDELASIAESWILAEDGVDDDDEDQKLVDSVKRGDIDSSSLQLHSTKMWNLLTRMVGVVVALAVLIPFAHKIPPDPALAVDCNGNSAFTKTTQQDADSLQDYITIGPNSTTAKGFQGDVRFSHDAHSSINITGYGFINGTMTIENAPLWEEVHMVRDRDD
ncbi:hypothetical protein B0T14DRAFT_556147 [Immersiella caudata]|uniref:Uncharacterized protein n=1 Tax=Immersiella caudata TaxID=314043 RepID=A0AA39WJV5_9PEZI|nr:hypothetical protein B0T14DRAFT_556147 [Immersiella caudata]